MMDRYRALFPVTAELVYLNHAAAGPLSAPTLEAMTGFLHERARRGSELLPQALALADRVRSKVAALIGADPGEIAFLRNTPDGLNVVANGLCWQPDDNVVSVDVEFPANIYPWLNLRDQGVKLRLVHARNGCFSVEDILDAIDVRTRLVTVSSVQFHGGFRADVERLGAECRKRGVYFAVDAIQMLGVLACDVRRMQVDFLSAASHKWLLGPQAVGIFYCRSEVLDQLRVSTVGQLSMEPGASYLDYQFTLHADARRFEPGVNNEPGFAGLEAAVDLLNRVGVSAIEEQVLELSERLIHGVERSGYELFGPRDREHRSGIVSFKHHTLPARRIVSQLRSNGIVVAERQEHIRVSPHFYNTSEEIDRLLSALPGGC
jgi:cysteine desulfurase / selenocysteine lyase